MNLQIAVLVLAALAPNAASPDDARVDPVEVSRHWLDALARRDVGSLTRLSLYPLRIRGFNLDSGPEAAACGARPRSDGIEGVRAFDPSGGLLLEVASAEDMATRLECLFKDKFLLGYIPPLREGKWPPDRRNAFDGNVGTLRKVTPGQMAKRLGRYRKEVRELGGAPVLVQARMTDNNGVTNMVLLALRKDGEGRARVFAVFVDELFEE
jgi:hypothetical protein